MCTHKLWGTGGRLWRAALSKGQETSEGGKEQGREGRKRKGGTDQKRPREIKPEMRNFKKG